MGDGAIAEKLMRWGLVWLSALALMIPACAADAGQVEARSNDELAERTAIFDQVKAAIDDRDYAALNAMAEEYRTRRARTPSGTWKLAYFYYGVIGHLPAENPGAKCLRIGDTVFADWAAVDPAAPAPYIAQAAALTGYGRCLRGGAYAAATAPEAVTAMREQVHKARDVLERHRDVASVDPQYYAEWIDILQVDTRPDDDIDAVLDEATSREPYYHQTYFSAARYLLPQWHGRPGDIERLARYAADRSAGDEGTGAYVRVFWSLEDCHCFNLADVDWPMMKSAMRDVVKAYPNDWNAANFARFACMASDTPAMGEFFALTPNDSGTLWQSHAKWEQCRRMTEIDGHLKKS
jgi:hypothetical protein